MRSRIAIAIAVAIITAVGTASAHEFRPCLLDVRALDSGRFEVTWIAPDKGPDADTVSPVFPAHCRANAASPGARRSTLDCGAAGLAGHPLAVRGLGTAHPDALVRLAAEGGAIVATAVLRADSPSMIVPRAFGAGPAARPRAEVARSYFGAGVEHILRGPDHLLFVLGLLLLVRRARPLVATITAFTLAHSVTLGLAAVHAVNVPPAPVEAAIALSLALVAAEIARPPAEPPSLARRRPWLVAFAFGLLHGFGFAGGLAELGVPEGEIPIALAAFNLGVEAGQLAFVAALLAALAATTRARGAAPPWLARIPAYAMGALAVSWCIERVARFWT